MTFQWRLWAVNEFEIHVVASMAGSALQPQYRTSRLRAQHAVLDEALLRPRFLPGSVSTAALLCSARLPSTPVPPSARSTVASHPSAR
jgi:hypothetical protein